MATIKYPGKHDVMLGRGGESNYHSGNIAFRHMVQKYKERFRLGSRTEKNKVIDEVVDEWRDQDPVGRFVAKKTTDNGEIVWYDVGNEMAKKRAAKSLAEWTPQVSFLGGSAMRSPPSARTKRSRGAGTNSSASKSEYSMRNKRQNIELPLTVNSCSVLNMAVAQQQLRLPEQQIRPLSFFQVAPGSSSDPTTTATSSSRGNSSSLAGTAPDSPSSASDVRSIPSIAAVDLSLNQANTVTNINAMNILPIERIRMQIPTAAELATGAFSDDDEDKSNSKRSMEATTRGSGLHGTIGLLPNKPYMRMMGNSYKGASFNSTVAPLGGGFSGTKSFLDDLMKGEDLSSNAPPLGMGFPGTKSLLDDLMRGEEVSSNIGPFGTGFPARANPLLEDLMRGEEASSNVSPS